MNPYRTTSSGQWVDFIRNQRGPHPVIDFVFPIGRRAQLIAREVKNSLHRTIAVARMADNRLAARAKAEAEHRRKEQELRDNATTERLDDIEQAVEVQNVILRGMLKN